MTERFKITSSGNGWTVQTRKGTVWLSLGHCTSHTIAQRVYIALQRVEGVSGG